mmetsp:Transcript_15079/g.28369  ORF Transcript_15079/g.28369 Transcript_15079/m.28369 type:complete len:359 (+) Transcript_15079:649-1725(+)
MHYTVSIISYLGNNSRTCSQSSATCQILYLHLLLTFPTSKPSNTVLSCPIKDISSMHTLVIVQKNNVSLCHFHKLHILHGHLIHVLQIFIGNISIVTKEHIALINLTCSIFKPFRPINLFPILSQFTTMTVHIAKPSRISRHGMNHNGRLFGCPSLQHFHIVISSLTPLQIHTEIHLGINRSRCQSPNHIHQRLLNGTWNIVQPSKKGQFHDGITNGSLVQLFHQGWFQISKDGTSISNEKFTSRLGSLETYKSCSTRSSSPYKFIVHPDKEVFTTFLIDCFVDRTVLGPINGRSGTDGMKRIQARIHSKCRIKLYKSVLLLHEIKVTKDDSSILHHESFELHGILLKVFQLCLLVSH